MRNNSDEQIARVLHEANRAYCQTMGDDSQVPWDDAPDHVKKSVLDGVALHRANPNITPERSHENWLVGKLNDGWKFGPVKDADKKEHPCILPYQDLPPDQKFKDFLFRDICRTFFHSTV